MPDQYLMLYFCYTTGWVVCPAVAGGVTNFVLNILADAPFQANYMTISVRQANVLVANWAGSIQIDDSARGKTLFNQAAPVQAFAGTGQLPYPFNPPRVFEANSSVTISFTNNVAVVTDVALTLHGNKMIRQGV
jgi:hypothetical protein